MRPVTADGRSLRGVQSDVAAGLDDPEAGGDVGAVGVRRVGGRVGAGAVEVGVRRRLVHEDPAEEVLAERDPGVERGVAAPARSPSSEVE